MSARTPAKEQTAVIPFKYKGNNIEFLTPLFLENEDNMKLRVEAEITKENAEELLGFKRKISKLAEKEQELSELEGKAKVIGEAENLKDQLENVRSKDE